MSKSSDVAYAYTRRRATFGRHCVFGDRPVELLASILPDHHLKEEYLHLNPAHQGISGPIVMSSHEVNTEYIESVMEGVNHTEGGWPKDVNCTDIEQVERHRKKMEREDSYVPTMKMLSEVMEHCVMQNNAVDIYERYFEDEVLPDIDDTEISMKVVCVFRDVSEANRPVCQISWHPEGPEKFAVAHGILKFQSKTSSLITDSYIWQTEDISFPEFTLRPHSPAQCLKFSPKDTNIIAGGLYSGQLSFWDLRKGMFPIESTALANSHLDPIYNCAWTTSKTGTEILTVSTDGTAFAWDMRNLSEHVEDYCFDPNKTSDRKNAQGGISIDFDATIPTKFMVGTEGGCVFSCNRKGKSPEEKISALYDSAHIGPIYAIHRNTFNPKLFLTVGDWKAKIWSEDVKDVPIMWTCNQPSYIYDACWSPTRPFVFLTCSEDGHVSAWDHLHKYREPVVTAKICDEALVSVSIQEQGMLAAVGSSSGYTTMLHLSKSLYMLQNNEKNFFALNIERECKREKFLDAKIREKKLLAMKEKEKPEGEDEAKAAARHQAIEEAEKAYLDDIKKERAFLFRRQKAHEVGDGSEATEEEEDKEKHKAHEEGQGEGHSESQSESHSEGETEGGEEDKGSMVEGEVVDDEIFDEEDRREGGGEGKGEGEEEGLVEGEIVEDEMVDEEEQQQPHEGEKGEGVEGKELAEGEFVEGVKIDDEIFDEEDIPADHDAASQYAEPDESWDAYL